MLLNAFLDRVGHLPVEQIVELFDEETTLRILELDEAEREEERYGKFRHLFPEETHQIGEFIFYAHELYPKHMEFFRMGASYRARCLMAANRVGKCRTYNDLIEHPDGRLSRIGDLFMAARPFDVMAWDGNKAVPAPASRVIRKPPEQVVELLMSDGSTFTCSLDHRVLTVEGWRLVRHLLGSVPCLPASSGEPDPLTHAGGDLHWSETVQDWRVRCSGDLRRYDERLLDRVTLDRSLGRQRVDAPQHIPASSASGFPARTGSDSPLGISLLPSSLGARLRCRVRSVAFLAQDAYRCARRSTGSRQGCGRLHAAAIALARSVRAVGQGLGGRGALVAPSSKATNRVVAYRPAGIHALYDLTVPIFANYVADGIVHHNTVAGAYEMTCHLTGDYPKWWEGKRFRHPIRAWACGKTNETTRDIVQTTLVGDVEYHGARKSLDGSGIIPRECIGTDQGQLAWKQGVQDLIDTVKVKHVSGGYSKLGFKSYQQGRGAFEGTAQHVIWDDEEPPLDIYGEQIIRTATTKGIMMLTFTPLFGHSEVVQQFLDA